MTPTLALAVAAVGEVNVMFAVTIVMPPLLPPPTTLTLLPLTVNGPGISDCPCVEAQPDVDQPMLSDLTWLPSTVKLTGRPCEVWPLHAPAAGPLGASAVGVIVELPARPPP